MDIFLVEGSNARFSNFFRFLTTIEEREKMIYKIGFTILFSTFNLFLVIFLSFSRLDNIKWFRLKLWKWLICWVHEILLGLSTRELSKSDLAWKSRSYKNFLRSIKIRIARKITKALKVFLEKISWNIGSRKINKIWHA